MNAALRLLLLGGVCLLAGNADSWTAAAPSTPQPFLPGIVSGLGTEESMVTASPDGRTLLWGASRLWFPMSRISEVRITELRNGAWTPAQTAAFSAGYSDADPFYLRDGSGVLISSMRPVRGPRRDFDIWFVPRTAEGWGRAVNLGANVNTEADELYATLSDDGTLYFASERSGTWHIYRARRQADGTFGTAEALPAPVNLEGRWSFNAFISADGRTMVFTGLNRPGGLGKGDLWVTRADASGRFGEPVNLGPVVNTPEEEFHPTLTPDGRALMFIRRNTSSPDGNAETMWVSTSAVPALRRP